LHEAVLTPARYALVLAEARPAALLALSPPSPGLNACSVIHERERPFLSFFFSRVKPRSWLLVSSALGAGCRSGREGVKARHARHDTTRRYEPVTLAAERPSPVVQLRQQLRCPPLCALDGADWRANRLGGPTRRVEGGDCRRRRGGVRVPAIGGLGWLQAAGFCRPAGIQRVPRCRGRPGGRGSCQSKALACFGVLLVPACRTRRCNFRSDCRRTML